MSHKNMIWYLASAVQGIRPQLVNSSLSKTYLPLACLSTTTLFFVITLLGVTPGFTQDPQVVAMRDTFCVVRSGPFFHLPKVGLVFAGALPASPQSAIRLTESITTACDSAAAKAAESAYFVPALRIDLLGGEGLIAIDVFGKSYWGGDWDVFLKKRANERAAQAQRQGAVSHKVLQELEPVQAAKAPMLFMLETSMYFRRGQASHIHSGIYYLRNGNHAIEIRVVTGNRNLLPGGMSQVERSVLCGACQQQ